MKDKTEIEKIIWTTLNKLRSDIFFSGFRSTKLLELIGTTQTQEIFDQVLNDKKLLHGITNTDGFTPPLYIYNFINNLSKFVNPQTHLDPWLTPSSPCNLFDFGTTTAFCINQTSYETIKTIFPNPNNTITLGDSWQYLDSAKETFDFITCFPPFGMRKEPTEINGFKTTNDFASTLLIKSSMLLNKNGQAVFMMPLSFFISANNKELINKLGLFVDAVFSIPAGVLAPYSNILTNLVILTKKVKENTFVAEIGNDEKTNNTILENYKSRKEGKVIQLGILVDIAEFKSLRSIISEKETEELIKRIGFSAVKLSEIALSVNAIKQDTKEEIENFTNSIYLPKIGNSSVITNPLELKIKPNNYFQIQLDETKAISSFVANYFNSEIGRNERMSLAVGAVISQLTKQKLANCTIYLPDLKTQLELIDVDSKIDNFALRLLELKRKLWKQLKNYNSIVKELKNLNQGANLEHWIDNLPFPISSILWRYYATKESNKKIEHLFHFFEALSEFLSMIMLSALVQDKDFYKQECHNWIGNEEKFKDWYLKATFGNWNNLTSNLSKSIRRYLSDADKKELCKTLFGNPTEAFMKILTEKGIINTLFAVAELRNKWKGHGGITSEEDNKQKVTRLEQQLNEMRKYIADGFEETKIVSAKQGELENGVWTFSAKELVGAKSPFRETEIQSLVGLDKKKLYLTHSNQNRPVELLPFIKFIEISDAVYFYTSIESKNVRWVSYHFDKDPELNQPADNELYIALEFLKQN